MAVSQTPSAQLYDSRLTLSSEELTRQSPRGHTTVYLKVERVLKSDGRGTVTAAGQYSVYGVRSRPRPAPTGDPSGPRSASGAEVAALPHSS